MTYAVVYSSRPGNTRLLAETIREQLPAGDCLYFGAPSPEALKAEMIFCGFWTDKGTCDENVASFLGSLKQQRVFLFGTAGFGGDPAYFEKILNTVKQCLSPSVSLCGGFLCQGKMPEGVRRRYEAMPDSPARQSMLENFDRALSHPDASDLESLRASVSQALTANA